MPNYTVQIFADHTGTARQIEIAAPNPWLALELSHEKYDWLCAEVFHRGESLGRVDHMAMQRRGFWQLNPAA